MANRRRIPIGQRERKAPASRIRRARVQEERRSAAPVQPEDVLPGGIDANLGAPWIPESDIQAFAAELFTCNPEAITIRHIKKDAAWNVEAGYAAKASVAATTDYGTKRINGVTLFEQALNMKMPTVYDPDPEDPDKKIINQDDTLAAREKQKLIKERFKTWLFSDPDLAERLVRFSLRVPALYQAIHLSR